MLKKLHYTNARPNSAVSLLYVQFLYGAFSRTLKEIHTVCALAEAEVLLYDPRAQHTLNGLEMILTIAIHNCNDDNPEKIPHTSQYVLFSRPSFLI